MPALAAVVIADTGVAIAAAAVEDRFLNLMVA